MKRVAVAFDPLLVSKACLYDKPFNRYVFIDILDTYTCCESIFSIQRDDMNETNRFTGHKNDISHRPDALSWSISVTRKLKVWKFQGNSLRTVIDKKHRFFK